MGKAGSPTRLFQSRYIVAALKAEKRDVWGAIEGHRYSQKTVFLEESKSPPAVL